MEDVLTTVSRLIRPNLLVQTARHGIESYNRMLHLRRLLKSETLPGPAGAILRLMEVEGVINAQRTQNRAEYSAARHIEVLVAIICEARLLKATSFARKHPAPVPV